MSNQTIRTGPNRAAFLEALARSANVTGACELVGVSRAAVYEWRDGDPEFAAEWDAAVSRGLDGLEDLAVERAKAGSDMLLIFLLKAHRPERYRETKHLTIDQNLSVQDLRRLPREELLRRLNELRAEQDAPGQDGLLIEADPTTDLDEQATNPD
jgi:hypothetical protein